jgi:hypothetical protein
VVKRSAFCGEADSNQNLLDEAITKSATDIIELMEKYFGFYEKKFNNYGSRIQFFFERNWCKIWNKIKKRSNTFPLLKKIVKNIYKNFGFDEKTDEECTKIILDLINEYFDLNINVNQSQGIDEKSEISNKKIINENEI